ncbi:hypothetical protein [Burkholderia pyrrocinia]|uniref:hypothetical protein n=1 Tax=Burkholderia pyrrocinia TaxID=60550 RepID=UPI001589DB64|nr:hypothetical protein [Burkholderia pyrrocinia]
MAWRRGQRGVGAEVTQPRRRSPLFRRAADSSFPSRDHGIRAVQASFPPRCRSAAGSVFESGPDRATTRAFIAIRMSEFRQKNSELKIESKF